MVNNNMAEKFTKVVVTMEVTYLIPMANDTVTEINGWTVPEVVQSWFRDFNIASHHASRDGWKLGNSEVVKDVRVVTEKDA